ncbi:hypothetical protein [Natrinema altunense]|uniref:hypothetical protein n=1 Tax=Natrinema altunense TaxID=222984 RepID=UPI0013EE67FC|nr:hypothetical protein [Natrinema altunense]
MYIEHVRNDLERIGVLDHQAPKARLFNLVQCIHSSFLSLRRAIEDDNAGGRLDRSDFEFARHVLADTGDLLDELEAEYESYSSN